MQFNNMNKRDGGVPLLTNANALLTRTSPDQKKRRINSQDPRSGSNHAKSNLAQKLIGLQNKN